MPKTQHKLQHTDNNNTQTETEKKMGKDQSKMATPPTVIRNSSKALELAMSPKQLNAVQEVILREYPFLESVYESMLLTDCSLPDCPIVFANDFVRFSSFFLFFFSQPSVC